MYIKDSDISNINNKISSIFSSKIQGNLLRGGFVENVGDTPISTTMMYVGVSTEQKAKALETLEDDTTRSISKKWKGIKKTDSLAHFLGLN